MRADRQTDIGNVYPMGRDGHDEDYRTRVCKACEELLEDAFHTNVSELAATHGLTAPLHEESTHGTHMSSVLHRRPNALATPYTAMPKPGSRTQPHRSELGMTNFDINDEERGLYDKSTMPRGR